METRVKRIMIEIKRNESSFTEKSFFGFSKKYSQSEVREIWFQGIEVGVENGLLRASLEGQEIEISANLENERHKMFYDNFLKLCREYDCAIQYHPHKGMRVIDLSKTLQP